MSGQCDERSRSPRTLAPSGRPPEPHQLTPRNLHPADNCLTTIAFRKPKVVDTLVRQFLGIPLSPTDSFRVSTTYRASASSWAKRNRP